MRIPILPFALFTLLTASCTKVAEVKTVIEVSTNYDDERFIRASDFLEEDKCIVLSATTNESIISDIERVFFSEEALFVFDRLGNKIVMFDKEGNFQKSTANRVGKGHNEYIHTSDAAFDREEGKIYMYCDIPQSIMIFDLSLNLLENIPVDFFITEIGVDSKYVYGTTVEWKDEVKFELIAIEKNDLSTTPKVVASVGDGLPGLRGMGKMMNMAEEGLYVSLPYEDKIMCIKEGEIVEEYHIDFGKRAIPANVYSNYFTQGGSHQFSKEYIDCYWSLTNIVCSDSLILFNTNNPNAFLLDRETHICHVHRGINHDIYSFQTSTIIPTQGLPNGILYGASPQSAKSYLTYIENNPDKANKEQIGYANAMVHGNPVLFLSKFK